MDLKEEKLYNENDMINFVDLTIHKEQPFSKTYNVGDLQITFRTRSMPETGELIEFQNEFKTATSALHNICMATLAFSLSKINDINYDKGTLKERMAVIQKMPSPKFKILVDKMEVFNKFIDQMSKDFDLFYKAP